MFLATHGVLRRNSLLFDNKSFYFSGVDEEITTNANYTMLDNSSYFSISVWVKLPDITNTQRIVYLVGGVRLFLYVRTNGKIDASLNSSSYYVRSNSGAITQGNWHHIVWTYDGTQTRYNRYGLYVDGVSNISSDAGSTSSSLSTFTSPLNIGRVTTTFLEAFIDEYAVWNSALTPTEVLEIYNSGTASDLNNLPSGTANPQNWWRSENATFDGTNFSIPDVNGTFPMTTSNMSASSISLDVPA